MNGTANPQDPVTLFYGYAQEDEPLRDELQAHLKFLTSWTHRDGQIGGQRPETRAVGRRPPERNRWEAAALAKLQIDAVTARSTDEALVRIGTRAG